jgi:hypothetical protein
MAGAVRGSAANGAKVWIGPPAQAAEHFAARLA